MANNIVTIEKKPFRYFPLFLILTFLVFVVLLWAWLGNFSTSFNIDWMDPEEIIKFIRQSGMTGPLIIIASMTIAVVLSPLPSAPIAMAAGAIYGHIEGTFYIFSGALLGAFIAFSIGRILGFRAAQTWLETHFPDYSSSDQQQLMWLVMASRLIPFISFDLVSYAAGITALSYQRFLLATAIGILPASFLLAYFGEAASEQSFMINLIIILALLIMAGVWRFRSRKNKS